MTQPHPSTENTETILKNAFSAAVSVADPQIIIPQYLEKIFPIGNEPQGKCLVVGAGKRLGCSCALGRYPQIRRDPIPTH
mgnify:CR=1 FL=1